MYLVLSPQVHNFESGDEVQCYESADEILECDNQTKSTGKYFLVILYVTVYIVVLTLMSRRNSIVETVE